MTDAKSVKLAFGKINLSEASGVLASFKVEKPFVRSQAINTGKTAHHRKQYSNATIHPSVGGGFTQADVVHPEGTILMLLGNRTRKRMRVADYSLFLRVRDNAAFIAVKFKLPVDRESVLGDSLLAFSGCADVLNAGQLAAMGIELSQNWARGFMNEGERDSLFDIVEIRPAQSAAPTMVTIATANGVEVKAMAVEPSRRMRLRR